MDYEQKVTEMMRHLGENFTPQNFSALVNALTNAAARTVALIPDHDTMHAAVDRIAQAMHATACQEHTALQPHRQQAVTPENFLRDHFKPEKFHG